MSWTILLVSAFLVVAFELRTIDIYLSPEVWALMGISVGSAAGSVIVKGIKADKDPDKSVMLLPPRCDWVPGKN